MTGFLGEHRNISVSHVTYPEEAPYTGQIEVDQQAVVQDLMAIKAQGQSRFEREQAAFLGQIQAHHASVENELHATVDPALSAAITQSHQALLAARRDAAQARQALTQHEAARPRVAGDVPTWARRKGEIADELNAYDAIAAEAEQAYRQAQGTFDQAMGQAWVSRRRAAQQELGKRAAEFDRDIAAAEAVVKQLWDNRERALAQLQEAVSFWDRHGDYWARYGHLFPSGQTMR